MNREIHVRLECDYHLSIPKDMKMDSVRDLLVDHFLNEGELESVGIEIIDRTDDKLKRLRKGKS
jgi:hypothetical protein